VFHFSAVSALAAMSVSLRWEIVEAIETG